MVKKPNLLVVIGSKFNTLKQMLNHYVKDVDNIYIVNYYITNKNYEHSYKKINDISKEFNAKIFEVRDKIFNFKKVTDMYNDVKMLKPDEWWIVADDDEFQIYSKPILEIIEDCEKNNFKFVRGGLIDKITPEGIFPEINEYDNLWDIFTMSSFFSEYITNSEPSKITLMKGDVPLTTGQHYTLIESRFLYPVEDNFTQVHHFKWDKNTISSLTDRINFAESPVSTEAERMLKYLIKNNFKINLKDFKFTEKSSKIYEEYSHWEDIKNYILERFQRLAIYERTGKKNHFKEVFDKNPKRTNLLIDGCEYDNLSYQDYVNLGFDIVNNTN